MEDLETIEKMYKHRSLCGGGQHAAAHRINDVGIARAASRNDAVPAGGIVSFSENIFLIVSTPRKPGILILCRKESAL